MTIDKANRQQMVGANFVSVGEDYIDLQDITLVGDDGSAGGSWVKWWDPATATYSDKAYWVNDLIDPDGDKSTGKSGWGDFFNWYPIEKTFAPGEGFWFCPCYDNVGVTISGEVVQQSTTPYVGCTVDKANRQIMVLNPFPTNLDLQDIILDGDDGSAGGSWVKWWDPLTATYSEKAYWVNDLIDPDGDKSTGKSGWGDFFNWYPIEKEFAVGGGFWFCPCYDNVTVCMPNPFYVEKK